MSHLYFYSAFTM